MCSRVRSPSGSGQIDCHPRFFQGALATLQLFSRNFTEWWLRVVCLKIGFRMGGLVRSFNFSPRKPFALFTAHITSYRGQLLGVLANAYGAMREDVEAEKGSDLSLGPAAHLPFNAKVTNIGIWRSLTDLSVGLSLQQSLPDDPFFRNVSFPALSRRIA